MEVGEKTLVGPSHQLLLVFLCRFMFSAEHIPGVRWEPSGWCFVLNTYLSTHRLKPQRSVLHLCSSSGYSLVHVVHTGSYFTSSKYQSSVFKLFIWKETFLIVICHCSCSFVYLALALFTKVCLIPITFFVFHHNISCLSLYVSWGFPNTFDKHQYVVAARAGRGDLPVPWPEFTSLAS